ncbi:hypothetical protein Pst134EA_032435 [Puccinia striiformis f. sp. tritici]|uniref:uncharacterized protein n=1 Tax=Puccinia striiformis f. sp. tritici TaxID=168172 RepID=UPI002008A934|nr:uncharacterized protein Pst134EA_032435 [Puccinia striiformis f. sp. tritici]KAH9444263.1 hypothetical protein Pst134EA_032435 [Puccinia striiformis f. sp. tritici]
MAKTLRVLNAVRDYKIGIPLTYEQYISHHPDQLISRLAARSQYLLALRLTEFLNLSPLQVFFDIGPEMSLLTWTPPPQPTHPNPGPVQPRFVDGLSPNSKIDTGSAQPTLRR